MISSFTRQIILGGKGYAPDEHHALYKTKDVRLGLFLIFIVMRIIKQPTKARITTSKDIF